MVAALTVGIKLKTGIFWWHFTAIEGCSSGGTHGVRPIGCDLVANLHVNRYESAKYPRTVQNAFVQTSLAKACH